MGYSVDAGITFDTDNFLVTNVYYSNAVTGLYACGLNGLSVTVTVTTPTLFRMVFSNQNWLSLVQVCFQHIQYLGQQLKYSFSYMILLFFKAI